jgi:hypothetical protein
VTDDDRQTLFVNVATSDMISPSGKLSGVAIAALERRHRAASEMYARGDYGELPDYLPSA